MNVDPSGTFLISLLIAAIAGAIAGAVIGGIYGAATAVTNGKKVGWGILIGVLSGLFLGAIAGVAGVFMAPLLTGAAAIGTLSAGAAFAIGAGISIVGGFVVGFSADLAIQAANNAELDWQSAALSGAQTSVFTVFSSMFGSLGFGFIDSLCVSIGSGILISTFNMLFDIIKEFLSNKNSPSIDIKAYYGI